MSDAAAGPRWVALTVAALATVMCVACILWNLEVHTRLGFAVLRQQYMALQLGLALTICFLRFGPRGGAVARPNLVDLAIAVTCLGVLIYAATDFVWLLQEQFYRPWQITLVGAVVVIGVMEGIRRRAGLMLFGIVAVFLVYALFADRVPGRLIGRELSPQRLVDYVGFDSSAVFSSPLAVGTITVLLFVFFGQLLFAAGGGAFFTDLAMAATGRARGGSAKIAVVGSALFGSISGSAVSNVATTGVITIPLMQRGGYRKEDAGAIEAVASTGGQLTPPIMGAAAFLMAEFLDIPYATVAAAALVPAILYYLGAFLQVDLIAARDGIAAPEDAELTVRKVLAKGWHFLIPFAVLLYALFVMRLDPEDSALLASLAIAAAGFLRGYDGTRLTLPSFGRVFVDTGTSMVDLILVVAAAGFVIGVLNVTGLGFALTLVLVDAVGSSLILLLLISAVVCIILGMGMPTSGVYVLLASLVAPSLVEAGVQPIAAHLFILYFGMMSMITPPVALAAFAAAAISKAGAFATGMAAMRIGWAAFILPFAFVSTPALLFEGTMQEVVTAACLTAAGIAGVTAGIAGYWGGRLGPVLRIAFVALGALALPLGFLDVSMVAHAIAAAVLIALAAALMFRRAGATRNDQPT
ncbi:TRAP transporter fused permease subunit [Roseibacterium sp. SDUM158016]|uniref:TRAP transporter permease n=1 Tax=Roseicyclus sediminis TaxID=2980997 RepID=UPI0021CF833B|nr:TRAP transporter fused permease subunit [Roseibacterium sp. SDUM158016]MCU4653729.1 TRAP transporter fused permease subunit [Roseibacterium sp. SDUM158016]